MKNPVAIFFFALLLNPCWAADASAPTPTETAPTDQTTEPKKDDLYNIEADVTEGVYKEGEQVLVLTGNVKVIHGTTTLTCDKAIAKETEKLITAEGNVRVVDTKDQMTLTCGYGEYYREKKYIVAMKSPVLVSNKNADRPIIITSDLMEAYLDANQGIATGNVHVVSGQTNATGSSCTYYGKEDHIDLRGEPIAWERDSKLVGDKMTLILRNQKVEEALVEDNVRLLYFSARKQKQSTEEAKQQKLAEGKATGTVKQDVPKLDQAKAKPEEEAPPTYSGRLESSGNLLHAYLRDDEMRVAFIEGSARGVYYPFDDFGKETGETLTITGRRLTAYFASGAVDSIVAEENAVSVYQPPPDQEGKTITQGEIISMYVIDGKVNRILVRGEAHGSYYGKPTKTSATEGSAGTTSTTNVSTTSADTQPSSQKETTQ